MSIIGKLPIFKNQLVWLIFLTIIVVAIGGAMIMEQESNSPPKVKLTKEDFARAYLAIVDTAILEYHRANKVYPESLSSLLEVNEGEPYLEKRHLADPWGNSLVYACPARRPGSPYDLYSCGPDGKDDSGKGDDVTTKWPDSEWPDE